MRSSKRGTKYLMLTDTLCKFRRRTGKCVQPAEYLKSGRFLMVQETFASAKGPSFQGGLKALKRHFQLYQADSRVKKVPKIDRYFS